MRDIDEGGKKVQYFKIVVSERQNMKLSRKRITTDTKAFVLMENTELFFEAVRDLFTSRRLELKIDKALCFPRMPDSDSLQLSAAITRSVKSVRDAKEKTKAE